MKIFLICLFCCIFLVGCAESVDKKKFENLYRSAKAIEGAVAVGVNYQRFGELLQNLSTEVSIMNDKVKSKKEIELLKLYYDALIIYKDSATLWEGKISGSQYDWIPSDAIYV